MIKSLELSQPNSCLNKARDDEYVFVLLGRDAATPETIRFWIDERIRLGKNKEDDEQIVEARELAANIEASLRKVRNREVKKQEG